MDDKGWSVRYDSGPWSRRSGAAREWVLEVEEVGSPVDGAVGQGQLLPDELLSVAGLDLALSPAERHALAREELAAVSDWEIRFEAVLEAGFAAQIASSPDVTAPRLTFLLHEMTEETGHQRLFQRLLLQLEPRARWPVPAPLVVRGCGRLVRLVVRNPALLYVLVLAGEEMIESFQRAAAEHPDTDPFVRAVFRHHLSEEADHVDFAQAVLAEAWVSSRWTDRLLVRRLAPAILTVLFDTMVHPGVYRVVGQPALPTWRAVRRSAAHSARRRAATRPVLDALLEAGALRAGRVPRAWRALCGVDAAGQSLTGEPGTGQVLVLPVQDRHGTPRRNDETGEVHGEGAGRDQAVRG